MSFRMFHEVCPEIGLHETRSVTLSANSDYGLPSDSYAFLDMRCFAGRLRAERCTTTSSPGNCAAAGWLAAALDAEGVDSVERMKYYNWTFHVRL
jgi:hypothetical protein